MRKNMGILSIQSHVVFGYVGNKAAVFPLQSMGYDVWPVNTVQFSTHTGYKGWRGDIFPREHIKNVISAIEEIGAAENCHAVLSGYMGSADICFEVQETVQRFKAKNSELIYLCDPVIGNVNCYVKPEVLDFFKNNLVADIITPNQFEAETLSGIKITDLSSLKKVADYFHKLGISVLVITGLENIVQNYQLGIFVSDGVKQHIVEANKYNFSSPINGTGDLFSAVFLGTYLATKNAFLAALNAAYYMEVVVSNTFKMQSKELQVISTSYDTKEKFMNSLEVI